MLHYQKFAAERTRFQVRIFYTHTPPSPPPQLRYPLSEKILPRNTNERKTLWFLIEICYLIEKCLICSKNVLWKWAHIFINWYDWQSLINDLDRSTGIYKEEVHLKTAIMLFINAALKYGPGKVSSFYLHITDVNYKYMGVILVGEIKFKK